MAGDQELSVTGGARLCAYGIVRFVVLVFFLIASHLLLSGLSFAQQASSVSEAAQKDGDVKPPLQERDQKLPSHDGDEKPPVPDATRLADAQKAFDAGRYADAARVAQGPSNQSANLDFLAGLSLAKLQRWPEARAAFLQGQRKAPQQARFSVELAGVDYKLKDTRGAKRELHAALKLEPKDKYTLEFLGTLYFLDGNLEAALKYWNAIEKPRLRKVLVAPPPTLDPALLQNAIAFNAPQILTSDALLGAEARLDNLEIYPHRREELAPAGDGNYDATFHMAERNLWGDTWWQGALMWLSGLPYETVYPQVYNLDHEAINVTSLLRWDSEKRRAFVDGSMPLLHQSKYRLHVYFDGRNENWNLTNTFFGGGPALSDLNVRRVAGGAELRSVMNGRWSWSTGIEIANRSFRNLTPEATSSAAGKTFFMDGNSISYWGRVDRSLLRLPEHRFTVDGSGEGRVGREFATGFGSYGAVRGSLTAHWLPQATGDDYEMLARVRAGEAFGDIPFDELYQLGIERDNDLWLRGHAGTDDGRKGAAPLGRRYFLANWELDKRVYSNGIFTVKLGPFVDNGAIADSSGLFGSQKWLWDTGAQCKIRVLSSVTVVLIYGRDLRGGKNVFYGTALH
jgi:tetratricopeptide (TPR) repeat protein